MTVWLNGRLTNAAAARLPVFDRGFLFGDGVYESLRAYGGVPFRLAAHLDRLAKSAGRLGFRPPARPALTRAVRAVLDANRLREARIRLTVTRGTGVQAGPTGRERPTALVFAVPYAPPPPAAYRDGVTAFVARTVRDDPRSVHPAAKSTPVLNNLRAAAEAKRAGADQAILLNRHGRVAEAAWGNVGWVRRGVVCTPALSEGILAGVTRAIVLELARRTGFPVREGAFTPGALRDADEAFVTASTIELLPLAALRGAGRLRRYPAARPVTRALQAAYRITVEDECGG